MENVQISRENADVIIEALNELIDDKNNSISEINKKRKRRPLLTYKITLNYCLDRVNKYQEIIKQLSGGISYGNNNIK